MDYSIGQDDYSGEDEEGEEKCGMKWFWTGQDWSMVLWVSAGG